MPSSRDTMWLCSRDDIDWWAKGFESRSLEDLAFGHDIENLGPHRASGDVATLLALLSYRPRRRKPYLYEMLRHAGLLTTCWPTRRQPNKKGPYFAATASVPFDSTKEYKMLTKYYTKSSGKYKIAYDEEGELK